tara:strand:+ start:721 stop:894 length:174 start_codon:yes stop_codon:yes gene_type:complete
MVYQYSTVPTINKLNMNILWSAYNEDAKNPRYTGSKGTTKNRKPRATRRKEEKSKAA